MAIDPSIEPFVGASNLGDRPARVQFMDSTDPTNRMPALFNPNELSLNTQAEISELNPIGSSQGSLQYGYTKAVPYTLNLPYSEYMHYERAGKSGVGQAIGFFRSFLYADSIGGAPRFLLMIWPRTAIIANAVRGVDVKMTQWDMRLNVRIFTITLHLIEKRNEFIDRYNVDSLTSGLVYPLPDESVVSGSARSSAYNIGSPLNMGGKGNIR